MIISYIIPAYNAEHTIERAVNSITNQAIGEDDSIEIIIVENGSTDETFNICTKLKSENITVLQHSDRGVSNARNMGLKNAKGDIIAFCDADDYVPQGATACVLSHFKNDNELDILVTGFSVQNGDMIKNSYPCNGTENWSVSKFIHEVFFNDNVMGAVWNKFFRKKVVNGNIFNKELSHCEDTEFLVQLVYQRAFKIVACKALTYCYIKNSRSATVNVECLFDNNDLRYNRSFEVMRVYSINDRKMNRMINAKIAKLAADHYFLQNLTQEQRGELGKTIRNYQKDFLRYYHNPKLICKVLTILLVEYNILACPPFPH